MKRSCGRFLFTVVVVLIAVCGGVSAMTLHLGSEGADFVSPGEAWRFYRGTAPASVPDDAWKEIGFDDSAWETGPAGFGFGDDDDATILDDMRGSYLTVYIRKEFSVASVAPEAVLELAIDYDDGFIAYLNSREVARRSMPAGPATHTTTAASHEAGTPEIIILGRAGDLLKEGGNLLAIEGHNISLTSSDFSLIPALRTAPDTVRTGDTYIVMTETVALTGRTDAAGTAAVMIGELSTDFDANDGTWQADITLLPGLNTVTARALDADANEVDAGSMEIVYVSEANHISGELTEDLTLSGAYLVEDTLTVPAERVLKVEPGTVVLMKNDVSIVVEGQLLADGTDQQPIRFTHYGNAATWKQILFVKAVESRLNHCVIEYADSEGAHQDYYEPGPRDYHEAVVVLACHIDVNNCTFQRLPDDSHGAEGDAIAIISDDPNYPGEATARISGCDFLGIGQGVHTRFSHVLVEDCFFTGKRGDNDDVDLWGESTPPPLIRNNIFLDPDHDDAINPTRCSPVIVGNLIAGTDDHGIVLRDEGSPILINNVVIDCANGGIAIENSSTATLINNTIVGCGRGLRLFDLGRWGPPYRLNPGGGIATVVNCIIWDCSTPIALADSSNTKIADRGSHITVLYSDIEGGRDGISVSGQHSTVTWGEGNIDADPLFADLDTLDVHLLRGSPAIDTADTTQAPETDRDGHPRPCGVAADMGAYEYAPVTGEVE